MVAVHDAVVLVTGGRRGLGSAIVDEMVHRGARAVYVYGPLRVARAFAPVLARNGGGALVNIHSVLSWLGGAGAYGASKAALWSVSNSLRVELSTQHTHVPGVHAGFIDTDMVATLQLPESSPRDVARSIVDGREAGAVEVLTDEPTGRAKAAPSGPVDELTFALSH